MTEPLRVVLTGSESTGKSTLGAALAEYYGVELVPEFVRAYAEERHGVIGFADHGPIARGQMALEDARIARARAAGDAIVVQDTDLLSTVVYCEHYFGACPAWIRETAAARRPDLYLLCDIDLAWVADGVRDRGHMRAEMQRLFHDAVAASCAPAVIVQGAGDERFERARDAVDEMLLRTPDRRLGTA